MSNKRLLLAVTLSLSACSLPHQSPTELPARYLACYALAPAAKNQCHQELGFEAEKLGFKQFINQQQLPCDSINDGPKFMVAAQVYLVQCQPKGQYLMRFDVENQRWQLVKRSLIN